MADFIYNQKQIPKEQWRYGLRSSAATGCGWIAVYNALHLLHRHAEIPDIIASLKRQLPGIHGNLGTSFWGPALFFREQGFSVKLYYYPQKFDQAGKQSPASILFYHWRQGCRFGAHFAACRYNGSQFIGFNTFKSSTRPDVWGDSISAFLQKNRYYGAILMTIDKPES